MVEFFRILDDMIGIWFESFLIILFFGVYFVQFLSNVWIYANSGRGTWLEDLIAACCRVLQKLQGRWLDSLLALHILRRRVEELLEEIASNV